MIKDSDIDELIQSSNQFQQTLDAIENLHNAIISLCEHMIGNKANELIPINEMSALLVVGCQSTNDLALIKMTYMRWKSSIDAKIKELKEEEFPSEIIL